MKYKVHYAIETDAYLFSTMFDSLKEAKENLHTLHDSAAFLIKDREFVKKSFTGNNLREVHKKLKGIRVYDVRPLMYTTWPNEIN